MHTHVTVPTVIVTFRAGQRDISLTRQSKILNDLADEFKGRFSEAFKTPKEHQNADDHAFTEVDGTTLEPVMELFRKKGLAVTPSVEGIQQIFSALPASRIRQIFFHHGGMAILGAIIATRLREAAADLDKLAMFAISKTNPSA